MGLRIMNSEHHPTDNKPHSTGFLNSECLLSFEISPTSWMYSHADMAIALESDLYFLHVQIAKQRAEAGS